jgi:hypothetical protein
LPDELTPVSDTSNSVNFIGELCLKRQVNIVHVRVFVARTPSNGENPNLERRKHLYGSLLSRQNPDAQLWYSEGTQYWPSNNTENSTWKSVEMAPATTYGPFCSFAESKARFFDSLQLELESK